MVIALFYKGYQTECVWHRRLGFCSTFILQGGALTLSPRITYYKQEKKMFQVLYWVCFSDIWFCCFLLVGVWWGYGTYGSWTGSVVQRSGLSMTKSAWTRWTKTSKFSNVSLLLFAACGHGKTNMLLWCDPHVNYSILHWVKRRVPENL